MSEAQPSTPTTEPRLEDISMRTKSGYSQNLALYTVQKLGELHNMMAVLVTKMDVVMTRIEKHEAQIEALSTRVRAVELAQATTTAERKTTQANINWVRDTAIGLIGAFAGGGLSIAITMAFR